MVGTISGYGYSTESNTYTLPITPTTWSPKPTGISYSAEFITQPWITNIESGVQELNAVTFGG